MSLLDAAKRRLELPELAGLDLDDPQTTRLRKTVIQNKPFLRKLYCDWYALLAEGSRDLPEGARLELGSGPGFIQEFLPETRTSDVVFQAAPDLLCSGEALPFPEAALAAIYLINVFHHIEQPRRFLAEVQRCLAPGGKLLMIEPYNTAWGRAVWQRLHHEPFLPEAAWESAGAGPLKGANGALPWIVFERDRAIFEREFKGLEIVRVQPFMPLAYLVSGGVSLRALWPGWAYGLLRMFERCLHPWRAQLGMFACIEIGRRAEE